VDATDVHNPYLTPKQAAEYCKISRVTLWRAAKSGLIKRYGPGTAVRYRKVELDYLMDARNHEK
jgi:excisionase family DNA binding protein